MHGDKIINNRFVVTDGLHDPLSVYSGRSF